jgi:hypothetical protein
MVFVNHSCFKAFSAEYLFSGLAYNSFFNKSKAASEILILISLKS